MPDTVVPGPRTAGVLLVLAAVGEVAEQLVTPLTGGDTRQDLADIAAHQGAFVVSVLVGLVSTVLYAPGFLGLAQVGVARSPRLARAAGWLAVGAMGGFLAVRLGQAVELAGVRTGLSHDALARLVDRAPATPIGAPILVMFLVGGFVGLVVLAVVSWRAGLPRVPCLLLAVFQPLDLVVPSQPVPWSHLVLLVALGWLATALWRRTA